MGTEGLTSSLWLNVGRIHETTPDKRLAIEKAKRVVQALGYEWTDLLKRDRRGRIAETRHLVSLHLRRSGFTYKEISETLHRINHTTSVYSVKQAQNLLDIDREYRKAQKIFESA